MPTYYNSPYRHRSDTLEVLKWLVGFLLASVLLTDCWGGRTEYCQGKALFHERTPGHYAGKTYISESFILVVETPSSPTRAHVDCSEELYYRTLDQTLITYRCQRTRWSNYTFYNHL